MLRRFRTVAAAAAAFALLGFALPASAGKLDSIDPHSVPASIDLMVMRPIGLVATAAGAVAFVPAAAATAVFHYQSIPSVFNLLVRGPYAFTFEDPIGSHGDSRSDY